MQLLCVLILFQICATGLSISHTCYYCQNHDPNSHWYYDENCGDTDYNGHSDICHDGCDVCYVHTYYGEDNFQKVERGSALGHHDGDCSNSEGKASCYCVGDLCNSYLCSDPGACTTTAPPSPSTTPVATTEPSTTTDTITTVPTDTTTLPITTTEPVTTVPTDPTTQPITTTEPFTTVHTDPTTQPITSTEPITTEPITTTETITTTPTDPTTVTTQTTTSPTTTPPSMVCYDCQMTEPSWDNYDANCNDPDYQGNTYKCTNCHSCYTQVLEDGSAVRGEAGAFQDGQCLWGTDENLGLDFVQCYCTVDLCNESLCEDC